MMPIIDKGLKQKQDKVRVLTPLKIKKYTNSTKDHGTQEKLYTE